MQSQSNTYIQQKILKRNSSRQERAVVDNGQSVVNCCAVVEYRDGVRSSVRSVVRVQVVVRSCGRCLVRPCPTVATLPLYELLLERTLNNIHAVNCCPWTYTCSVKYKVLAKKLQSLQWTVTWDRIFKMAVQWMNWNIGLVVVVPFFITGPPTYNVGGQTSDGRWRLSSSLVVCHRL